MLGLVSNNNVPTNVSDQRLVKVEVSRVHVMVVHVLVLIFMSTSANQSTSIAVANSSTKCHPYANKTRSTLWKKEEKVLVN